MALAADAAIAGVNFKEANAMMEFLSRNLDTVLLIALLGFKLLEFIAPKTATTADDKIVSAISWALAHANSVFNIVEDLSAAGLIKVKTEAFREELQKQYPRFTAKTCHSRQSAPLKTSLPVWLLKITTSSASLHR